MSKFWVTEELQQLQQLQKSAAHHGNSFVHPVETSPCGDNNLQEPYIGALIDHVKFNRKRPWNFHSEFSIKRRSSTSDVYTLDGRKITFTPGTATISGIAETPEEGAS
jgi:hypothetical protein